jgi:hypothetical protein
LEVFSLSPRERNIWRAAVPVLLWVGVMAAVLSAAFLLRNLSGLTPGYQLERQIGLWLLSHSKSSDVIMSNIVLKERQTLPIPTPTNEGAQVSVLLGLVQETLPAFVVSTRHTDWQYVTGTPWFKGRYEVVAQFGGAEDEVEGDTAVPYTIWQQTPNPPPRINVDNRFNLIRTEFNPTSLVPGQPLTVTLYYEAQQPLTRPFYTNLQLLAPNNNLLYATATHPTPQTSPLAWWQTGQIIREQYQLLTPADLPHGAYRLSVALQPQEDGVTRWPLYEGQDANAQDQVTVGYVAVPVREPLPWTTLPVGAKFGEKITLQSYDIQGQARPGQALSVVLHWAGEAPPINYHVFVHLLDEAGNLISGHDGPPMMGQYPARGWYAGDIVPDGHWLTLDRTVLPGRYTLKAGLYDPQTLDRLPVTLADGTQPLDASVWLGEVWVEE